MVKYRNIPIEGSRERKIPVDIYFEETNTKKPIIIFSHGFKGFKDWGGFPLMAEYFAEIGYVFVKFNYSYNGGTIENPIDFPDLEAFGRNTYTTELDDIGLVIDFVCETKLLPNVESDIKRIYLLGHSRGGGITILKANEDPRVKKLATLASVSNYGNRFSKGEKLKQWEEDGVEYVFNSRTKQQMPMYFDIFTDFKGNEDRLDILKAAGRLKIPFLILHGEKDTTVTTKDAMQLSERCKHAEVQIFDTADHTFNMKHPWQSEGMSVEFEMALEEIGEFFGKG